ncbi:hypothetical protein AB0O28_19040 [Microbispora sp. NPDC088329]|uniref:hypothetical protein n=1 Tax=Microbispora sp. NPDC088329 TaxID=3154869 RepID=UPI0034401330
MTDLPRYTTWDAVPGGLYTKTQLGRLDPPRKLAKGAQPTARVLYHGNKYAALYGLDATVVKEPPTEAQLASVRRATAARHICKRCDARTHPVVTPDNPPPSGVDPYDGRLCARCHDVVRIHQQHGDYQRRAKNLMDELAERGAIVVQADDRAAPRRLALVEFFTDSASLHLGGGRVLADFDLAPPGVEPEAREITYLEAIGRLDRMFRSREDVPVFVGWEQNALWPLVMLANHDMDRAAQKARHEADNEAGRRGHERWSPYTAAEPYTWMQQQWNPVQEATGPDGTPQTVQTCRLLSADVRIYWAHYHAEPSSTDDDPRYFHPRRPETMPRATGDVVVDAHLLMEILAAVADGTEPVSPRAPWKVFPPQPGYVDGSGR